LSDFWPHGAVAEKYGILRAEGYTERALFVIDKQGIIRYIDIHDIDKQPENEVLFAELRRIDPIAAAREPKPAAVPAGPAVLPHGGIVMYCTSWCPACKRARLWFKDRNIPFTEVDVNAVPGAAQQVRQWANGNLSTPTFDIDGTIVVNFDERRVAELLRGKYNF
jgi:glutaredoxin